jgi:adenylate cyclase
MKKPADISKWLFATGIALVALLVVAAVDDLDVLHPLEQKAYDGLFYLKAKINPAHAQAPIALIAIDDKTFDDPLFRKPLMLWYTHFADVIDSLVENGARMVALDFMLPDVLFDDYLPGYSIRWIQTFFRARQKQVPVITGYMELDDRQLAPHKNYLQIIGRDHLGSFNLTTDTDDFIRRPRLWQVSQPSGEQTKSFAYTVATVYDPSLTTSADRIYIDFINPVPAFQTYSFADVFKKTAQNNQEFMQAVFKDKMVFIGSTDARNHDKFSTPLNYIIHKKVSGVEIHAHIVNTLFTKKFYAELSQPAVYGIYLVLCMTVCFTVMFCSQGMLFPSLPGLLMVFAALSIHAFINYWILPFVQGGLAILLGYFSALWCRFYIFDREKRKQRNLLKRYLPPVIVDQLLVLNDTDLFKGEDRRLCILFSDIRSFTSYSEKKPPAVIVDRLNQYFDAMADVVITHGGIVDKYIGDGLLAFFGLLRPEEETSISGIRCADAMLTKLTELNQLWTDRGEAPFKIGIGLHTGQVMVGNIGRRKTEFTVIGDNVNLASRLESMTKELKAAILISEAVYQDTQTEVIVEPKGLVALKGRSPEKTYELIGLVDQLSKRISGG